MNRLAHLGLNRLPVFAPPDPPAAGTPPASGTPPATGTPPAGDAAAAAAAAAPATGTPPANALGGTPGAAPAASAGDWPADWRERMATDAAGKVDTKVVERLKRYDSPSAFGKAGLEAQTRILSGKAGEDVPMPDETKDAEGAKKWREERGIPADPTGYVIPDAVKNKLTAEDAPVLANYTAYAHKAGMTPKEVERNITWYTGLVEQQAATEMAADKEASTIVETDLRKEWGAEFADNYAMAKKFASESIHGVNWWEARLPDGRSLGNITGVVKAMTELGLLKYGDVSYVGGEAAKATESRLTELKNIMTTDFDRWNSDPKLRAEYGTLLEKQEKANGSRAGA